MFFVLLFIILMYRLIFSSFRSIRKLANYRLQPIRVC